jgi:ketosteroid isomerase-like protein
VRAVDAAREELWSAVNAIYAGFLVGDRDEVDRWIADDATIWDSAAEPLVRGKAELNALRDARPADGPRPVDLRAVDPVIDLYGDTGVVRHVLLVRFAPDAGIPDERIRNTSVWRRVDGRWQCVHNHEDVVG